MRKFIATTVIAAAAMTLPVGAQEYWEYETWEGEYERHEPTRGVETEYESDWWGWGDYEGDREYEQYEWEPGEGYHEQEWYDPSDWFDVSTAVDYETDENWWDTGYAGDDTYAGYYYEDDYQTVYEQEYGYRGGQDQRFADDGWGDRRGEQQFGDFEELDYDEQYRGARAERDDRQQQDRRQQDQADSDRVNRVLTGRVKGLSKISGVRDGQPDRVVLDVQTQQGQTRRIALGDPGYVRENLPTLRAGDPVSIGGQAVNVDGREMVKASEVRTRDARFGIPDYQYEQSVTGKLTGLRQVRTADGSPVVVARVQDQQGDQRLVLLGSRDDLRGSERAIRPNSRVRIEGYRRTADGQDAFVVQNVSLLDDARQQRQRDNRAQQQQQNRRGNQAQRDNQTQRDNRAQRDNGQRSQNRGQDNRQFRDQRGMNMDRGEGQRYNQRGMNMDRGEGQRYNQRGMNMDRGEGQRDNQRGMNMDRGEGRDDDQRGMNMDEQQDQDAQQRTRTDRRVQGQQDSDAQSRGGSAQPGDTTSDSGSGGDGTTSSAQAQ